MDNVIAVNFPREIYSKNVLGLKQWDKGIFLEISGLETDCAVQVHFALDDDEGNAVQGEATVQEGKIRVKIPSFIFEGEGMRGHQYIGYAFIYITNEHFGRTVRKIRLFINRRPKPEDYVYTEEELKEWEALNKRVNELEKNGVSEAQIAAAVNLYLEKNPIHTGATKEEAEQIWKNRDDIIVINKEIGDVEILLSGL